jgi:hypothetical protein
MVTPESDSTGLGDFMYFLIAQIVQEETKIGKLETQLNKQQN